MTKKKIVHHDGIIHDYLIKDAILESTFFCTNDIFKKVISNINDKNKLKKIQQRLPSGADNVLKNRIRWMIFNLKIKKKIIKVKDRKGFYKVS